jgi:hypothetical protein
MRMGRLLSGLSLLGLSGLGLAHVSGCSTRGDAESVGQTTAALSTTLRIEQVYAAGGNSGAVYKADYVVLRNVTGASISLAGYSLQYASATGTSWSTKVDLSGVVPANGYFLIALASGTNGIALPTADLTSASIALSASAGKLALVSSTTALSAACPATGVAAVVDFVGYGSTASCYEGTAAAPAPTATEEIYRTGETDNNQADFAARAPTPKNSGGAAADAGADSGADAGTDSGADASVDAGADAPAEAATEAGVAASLVLLNEVRHNPVGSPDSPYEYVELRCTPNGLLTGYQFVAFEGDFDSTTDAGSNGPRGVADRVLDLGGYACGSNGLVYIRATNGATPSQDPATTEVAWAALDTGTSPLENATTTFALIKGGTVLAQGTDYDTNDDHTLELPNGAAIVDAVGTFAQSDGGVDFVYGGVTIALANGAEPEAVVRLPNNADALSAAAWYGGRLAGTDGNAVDFDSAAVTTNFPSGSPKLTPGAANQGASFVPDAGGPSDSGKVDAKPDAAPPVLDSGPDSTVADGGQDSGGSITPTADSGKKDTGTATYDAGDLVVDDGGGCSSAPIGSAGGTFALGGLFAMMAARLLRRGKR